MTISLAVFPFTFHYGWILNVSDIIFWKSLLRIYIPLWLDFKLKYNIDLKDFDFIYIPLWLDFKQMHFFGPHQEVQDLHSTMVGF